MKAAFIFLLFGYFITPSAQELVTDRPDQTESSSVVPRGTIQIETGVLLETDQTEVQGREVTSESLRLATTLMRVGLTSFAEFRVASEYERNKIHAAESSGINGVELGMKMKLAGESGWRPETAVMLSAGLPVGNQDLTGNRIVPGFLFAFSHTLTDRIALGYNLGSEYSAIRRWEVIYSTAGGIALTERLGAFLELYGSKIENEAADLLFDAGCTWLLNARTQLDVSFGYAFTESAPDWFINGGFAFRLPK